MSCLHSIQKDAQRPRSEGGCTLLNEIIFPMAKSYSVKIYRNFTAEEFKQKMQKVFYKRFEQQLKSFI